MVGASFPQRARAVAPRALLPAGDLESAAQLMTGLSAVAATATLATVTVLRLWRGDPVGVALGAALVVGPVGYVMICTDPRPEYLGFPAFLSVMAGCRARSVDRAVAAQCWQGLAADHLGVVTLADPLLGLSLWLPGGGLVFQTATGRRRSS